MSRIFIVDDEPMICLGLQEIVKEYDRFEEVHTYSDGRSALTAILADPPDLVMTDIRMPRMNGIELCRQIREHHLDTKVIVLSGYGDFHYAQQCMSYGVKEYLLKPVTETELYPVLDKIVNEGSGRTFSLSRFEAWMEQIEEALWLAQEKQLEVVLAAGRSEFFEPTGGGFALPLRMAVDGLELLAKKLNARGIYNFEIASELLRTEPFDADAFHAFSGQIDAWLQQLSEYRGGGQVNFFEASLEFIDRHLCEDLTLETVAARLGLTPTYFSHYFKKMSGEPFVQYRLRKRMEEAKRLLSIPHYKIIDVVAEVGYDSYPHFSRIFKKSIGCSPTEYRSMLGIK
ncbi:response regulator [Paenibacillus allorhizosphaerae]|uniref:Regulator of RpoS n=1 Tax=Paenibacillus allorhizosphaerae TaxID=2849866 RepID=A0ABN7TID5_9BACL|nr:response regulator [Paenibacillus allorhizosphaerae]CAG7631895.1 Regulator of RpoS [Paenibacillus allorhizosphaerae]